MHKKLIVTLIGLVLLVGGGAAGAGESKKNVNPNSAQKSVSATKENSKTFKGYVFVKGKGVELCDAYYKNLVQFHPRDIACERVFNPQFVDFRKPTWDKWDLTENKNLVIKVKKFLLYADQSFKITDLDDEKLLTKNLKDDPYFIHDNLYFSTLDIDNDGNLDNMILYDEGRCMDMHVFAKPLLRLIDGKTMIDVVKTDPLLQNPSSGKDMNSRAINHLYNIYDVFFYKDKVYYDRWTGVGSFCRDVLSVYELSNRKAKEICSYKIMHGCK